LDLGDGATADGTLRLLLGAERSEASRAVDVSASGYLDGLASDHIKADGAVELLAKGDRHIVELLGDVGWNVGWSGCLAVAGRTGNGKETNDANRLVRTAGHRLIILCPRIGLRTTARGMDIVGLGHLEGKGLEGIRKGGLTSNNLAEHLSIFVYPVEKALAFSFCIFVLVFRGFVFLF
jgi:hypothetical protein